MENYNYLYNIEKVPTLQNLLYKTPQEAQNCLIGKVQLVEDLQSGLIYNIAFDEKLAVYNQNYQNEQAHSEVFQNHLSNVANIIKPYFYNKKICEVGCGKATFLHLLEKHNYNIFGLDPAYEGYHPLIIKKTLQETENINAEAIILRHTLEHVINPYNFLNTIKEKLSNKQGLIYIEVPCFEWILKHNAWFDIFYEHVNYFRLSDLQNFFEVNSILTSGKLFGEQYLYIIADLKGLKKPIYNDNNSVIKYVTNIIKTNKQTQLFNLLNNNLII